MYMYKSSLYFLYPFAGTPSQNLIKGAKKFIESGKNRESLRLNHNHVTVLCT